MIRKATIDDVDELYLIETVCFRERRFQREHILWILHHPNAATYIDREDRTRGTLMLLVEGPVCRVLSLAVHPAFRRRGIGKALMTLAENYAVAHGSSIVKLEVSTKNDVAIDFYKSLGYENAGFLSNYYSWGEDAFSMSKNVASRAKT